MKKEFTKCVGQYSVEFIIECHNEVDWSDEIVSIQDTENDYLEVSLESLPITMQDKIKQMIHKTGYDNADYIYQEHITDMLEMRRDFNEDR